MTDLAIRPAAVEMLEYAPHCLTYASAAELKDTLAEWAQYSHIYEAALDLTQVASTIDSQGLGLLARAAKRINQESPESRLKLINPHPHVLRILEITKIIERFEIVYDSSRYESKQDVIKEL